MLPPPPWALHTEVPDHDFYERQAYVAYIAIVPCTRSTSYKPSCLIDSTFPYFAEIAPTFKIYVQSFKNVGIVLNLNDLGNRLEPLLPEHELGWIFARRVRFEERILSHGTT